MATPTAPTPPVCPLAISERTLSALRDDMLSEAETTHLKAHAGICPTCRSRLSSFNDLAALLQSEQAPEPDDRLWHAFVTSSRTSPTRHRLRMLDVPLSRQTWSRFGAVAAVLLLTLGFLTVSSLHHTGVSVQPTPTASLASLATATVTPAPTATPDLLPAHPLTWSPAATGSPGEITVSATDGESAYACTVTSDAQGNGVIHISRTSDRGSTWTAARSVPAEPAASGCELVVDASDPSVAALAWASRGAGGGDLYTGLMTTVDGGATWQAHPQQPFVRIDQLDSRGGVIYALRETADSSGSVENHLWASSDRMATWRQVDAGQTLSSGIAGFWLQPDGPGILAVVGGGANAVPTQLFYSPDDGAHWRLLTVPGGQLPSFMPARFVSTALMGDGTAYNGIIARWIQGQFYICETTYAPYAPTSVSNPPSVMCSDDTGMHWQTRPVTVLTNSEGAPVGPELVAIADDGDLLVAGPAGLYRLLPGSDAWQFLGEQPQRIITYCSTPEGAILMAIPLGPSRPGSIYVIYTASYAP